MQIISQHHELAAALIARVFLGFLFLFQGYDAVFNVKIKNVVATYQNIFATRGIPKLLTWGGSYFTSYVELFGGLLLILGLFQPVVLCLLSINLIIASIAFGITTPMWDMRFVFPRLVLVIFLLIIPESWNAWSLDTLFHFTN